jgi:hypothetical protein
MKTTRKSPSSRLKGEARAFTLRRAQFAKISAVEGINLSEKMVREFEEFDKDGLSAEERRRAIISGHAKSSV